MSRFLLISLLAPIALSCKERGPIDSGDSGPALTAFYYTAFQGEVAVQPGLSWQGDEHLKVMLDGGVELLCTWSVASSSAVPATDCGACDFAFEIELTEAEEDESSTRCDILSWEGYAPEDIEGKVAYGYEHGAASYWTDYGYPITGAFWYRYGATWYSDPLAYARWTETDPPNGRLYYFYYWISGYYYR